MSVSPPGAARRLPASNAPRDASSPPDPDSASRDTPGNFRSTPSRPSDSSCERSRTMTQVALGMHGGFDFDRRAVEHEAAREPPGPHVERLAGRPTDRRTRPPCHPLSPGTGQAPQRKAVRVFAQPLDVVLLRLVPVGERGILLLLAAHLDGLQRLLEREALADSESCARPTAPRSSAAPAASTARERSAGR